MRKILIVTLLVFMQTGIIWAETVDLGSRSREMCVSESENIIVLDRQEFVAGWQVNGRSINENHIGSFATIFLDRPGANYLWAMCNTQGNETFNIRWNKLLDPDTYNFRYYLRCLECVSKDVRVQLRNAKAKIEKTIELIDKARISREDQNRAVKDLKYAKTLLQEARKSRNIHKLKRIQIDNLIAKIDELINEVLKVLNYDRTLDEIEAMLKSLLVKIKLTPIVPVRPRPRPRPIGPTPTRPIQ
jgi:hypothetical protein